MVIRLGIIGLSADPQAWTTMAHGASIKGSLASQYTITALATSTPETAKASAKAHGLPEDKGYSSPEDIANDPDVDMVVVSVKSPLHKQLTTSALRAQKDGCLCRMAARQWLARSAGDCRPHVWPPHAYWGSRDTH
ncbi:MAG: hypothetical protein Q9198_005012 [Flavoplaca austrocitrina]